MPVGAAALAQWFDAMDVDLQSNATQQEDFAVLTWKNKGYQGAAADMTSTLGTRPIWDPDCMNGKPGVLFAVGKTITGSVSPVALNAPRHIFIVTTINAAIGGYYYISRADPATNASWSFFGLGENSNIYETMNSAALSAPPRAGYSIVEYGCTDAATPITCWINGVQQGTSTAPGSETAPTGCEIGRGFTGPISEVRVYDAIQSRSAVYEELRSKWSIPVPTPTPSVARQWRTQTFPSNGRPIYALPLGDSITKGSWDELFLGGYRGPLFTQMNPRLFPVGNQVGDFTNPDGGGSPAFPKDHHQGIGGTTTGIQLADIATTLSTIGQLDVTLLHLGSNVSESDAQAALDIVAIMQAIWAKFPVSKIIVANIDHFGVFANQPIRAAILKAQLEVSFPGDARWSWMQTPTIPGSTDTWPTPGLHMTHGGAMVLARAWANALEAIGLGP